MLVLPLQVLDNRVHQQDTIVNKKMKVGGKASHQQQKETNEPNPTTYPSNPLATTTNIQPRTVIKIANNNNLIIKICSLSHQLRKS